MCYRSSLSLALEHNIKTIAFPAISCGIYGYPVEAACKIAIRETADLLAREETIERVIFACFENEAYQAYLNALKTVYREAE